MSIQYYYQEITCLPDQEISTGFVLGKVMDAVHLAMVNLTLGTEEQSQCPIGISFPEYRESPGEDQTLPIGSKVRLFSRTDTDLVTLDLVGQLTRLSDYVHWTSIRALERRIRGYAIYRRHQPKCSKPRLIRRQMRRKGISETEAAGMYGSFEPRYSRLPYVNMRSHSTGERFRLYVERQETAAIELVSWGFSTYGLSSRVAVPEF